MHVVLHLAVRETAPPALLDRPREQPEIGQPVVVVEVDDLLAIASGVDVEDPILDLLARATSHVT
jgi:hypothetical protein